MIFPIVRTFVRRPPSTVAALTANRVAFTLTNTERVARTYSISLTRQSTHIGSNGSLSSSRSFATRPASRPKAHTGRTTSTPRKKALPAAGAATTGEAIRTKKPKAIPTAPGEKRARAKPKAKAKPKRKPKPKPKPKSKPKPKPKARKVLTAEEKASKKSKAVLAKLKETALVAPKDLPQSAWLVLLAESSTGKHVNATSIAKDASAKYRSLTPEELEHYNHIANQNRARNLAVRKEWVDTHTPEEIYRANLARSGLTQRNKKSRTRKIKDDRIVKRPRNGVTFFIKERHASGDFKGIKLAESAVLIMREYKGLTDSERKKYQDAADQDLLRYKREVKAVYHRDMRPRTKAFYAA